MEIQESHVGSGEDLLKGCLCFTSSMGFTTKGGKSEGCRTDLDKWQRFSAERQRPWEQKEGDGEKNRRDVKGTGMNRTHALIEVYVKPWYS